jgi:hypothetical protein
VVGRDQEGIDAGIVGRAEAAVDQPDRPRRRAIAIQAERLGRAVAAAAEAVGAAPVLALLFAEGADDRLLRRNPDAVERGGIPARLPIAISEAHGPAQRVDLPLALGHAGLHLGLVFQRPRQVGLGRGIAHEGVGIGIEQHRTRLAGNGAAKQRGEMRVLAHQVHIGQQLGAAVAQPHAGMSPVMTKASTRPLARPSSTVVSSVLG